MLEELRALVGQSLEFALANLQPLTDQAVVRGKVLLLVDTQLFDRHLECGNHVEKLDRTLDRVRSILVRE